MNLKLPIDNLAAQSNTQVFLVDLCVLPGGGRDLRHEDGDGGPDQRQRGRPGHSRQCR